MARCECRKCEDCKDFAEYCKIRKEYDDYLAQEESKRFRKLERSVKCSYDECTNLVTHVERSSDTTEPICIECWYDEEEAYHDSVMSQYF